MPYASNQHGFGKVLLGVKGLIFQMMCPHQNATATGNSKMEAEAAHATPERQQPLF